MFFQRMPIGLSSDALRALHPSLNTPAVSIEDEPAAPARAALAVLQNDEGRVFVRVAIRRLEQSSATVFGPDEESAASETPALLIESALAFAESMGFLLDDDLLAEAETRDAAARARALALWSELLGSAFVEPAKPEAEVRDESWSIASPIELRGADAPTAIYPAPSDPPQRRPVALTKFRVTLPPKREPSVAVELEQTVIVEAVSDSPVSAVASGDPAVDARGSDPISIVPSIEATPEPIAAPARLGRVRLLRRRSAKAELPRPGWLQRLLSAF